MRLGHYLMKYTFSLGTWRKRSFQPSANTKCDAANSAYLQPRLKTLAVPPLPGRSGGVRISRKRSPKGQEGRVCFSSRVYDYATTQPELLLLPINTASPTVIYPSGYTHYLQLYLSLEGSWRMAKSHRLLCLFQLASITQQ